MLLSFRSSSSKPTGHEHLGGMNADHVLCRRFCNGGTLERLMDKYYAQLIAIPEHFIW